MVLTFPFSSANFLRPNTSVPHTNPIVVYSDLPQAPEAYSIRPGTSLLILSKLKFSPKRFILSPQSPKTTTIHNDMFSLALAFKAGIQSTSIFPLETFY